MRTRRLGLRLCCEHNAHSNLAAVHGTYGCAMSGRGGLCKRRLVRHDGGTDTLQVSHHIHAIPSALFESTHTENRMFPPTDWRTVNSYSQLIQTSLSTLSILYTSVTSRVPLCGVLVSGDSARDLLASQSINHGLSDAREVIHARTRVDPFRGNYPHRPFFASY